MKNFEEIAGELKTSTVTPENKDKLSELRSRIDKDKSKEKLVHEAEKYAEGEGRVAFISEQEGTTTGFVEIILDEELPVGASEISNLNELAHLARIGVTEEYRGRGIGKKLLAEAEEWAKQEGKKGMWLDYLTTNDRAQHLYASAGYKDVAEFTDTSKNKPRRIAVKMF